MNQWAVAFLGVFAALAMGKGKNMADYKKPSQDELKKNLTFEQFNVTQNAGTEQPYKNAYWNHYEEGIYVDVVSGEPLFSSLDKYDSKCGWPSFSKPIEGVKIKELKDNKLAQERTEVRSGAADSHLGHVFNDGPPSTGLRYCINSAAMRFVPKDRLEAEGYGQYLPLFGKKKSEEAPSMATLGARFGKKYVPDPLSTATLAGGCFWGMEDILRKLPGVVDTRVGYTGGYEKNPTYETVKKGSSGHAEAIEIRFDPKKVSYEKILELFFKMHDPTTKNRQGNDVGTQYRSAIFYQDEDQKKVAERVKAAVQKSGKWKKDIVTEISPLLEFYAAEDYHQDYLVKNPGGYSCHFIRE